MRTNEAIIMIGSYYNLLSGRQVQKKSIIKNCLGRGIV